MHSFVISSRSGLMVSCKHGTGHQRQPGGARRWSPGKQSLQRETPLRRYLRSTLALQEPLLDQLTAIMGPADLSTLSDEEVADLVDPNLQLLDHLAPNKVKTAVCRNPRLLLAPLTSWYTFCRAYYSDKLEGPLFWNLINHPTLLQQGSVFRAGRAIMFLRENGWSDLEIRCLVFPYHAAILQQDDQLQLRPVLDHLIETCAMSPPCRAR